MNNCIRYTLLLFSLLISHNGIKAQGTNTDDWILAKANEHLAASHATGLSIGYIVDGEIKMVTLGYTDQEQTDTIDTETIYEIGSISKTIVGLLLQQAIADGKMDMQSDFRAYYPAGHSLSDDVPEITIQDLATHHSSLPRLPGNIWNKKGFKMTNPYAMYDSLDVYSFMEKYYAKNPKKEYAYSNFGAGLLGHLIGLQYDQSVESLLHKYVFGPLDMTHSSINNVATLDDWSIAKGHDAKGNPTPNWDFKVLAPAGGIKCSISDMMQYAQAYTRSAQKSNPLYSKVLESQREIEGTRSIATFWQLAKYKGINIIHHSGMTGGYASTMMMHPEKDIVIVALTNTADSIEPLVISVLTKLIKE